MTPNAKLMRQVPSHMMYHMDPIIAKVLLQLIVVAVLTLQAEMARDSVSVMRTILAMTVVSIVDLVNSFVLFAESWRQLMMPIVLYVKLMLLLM